MPTDHPGHGRHRLGALNEALKICDYLGTDALDCRADGGSNHFDGTTNIARVDRLITASEEGAVRLCQNTVDWYFAHHAQSGRGSEHALVNGEIAAAIDRKSVGEGKGGE